ncbi:TfpX/TfpZ family type IV pilin accessory protein [Pseudomonas sp. RIT-PI-AD]|uniref:TfpX/TfpZ family type IV pilin accessory protein n=1 Tax=Pseudomonas sp. RIT-PI-AD TaxID=3035294 RepID=UPI0021D9AE1C|nr:TfpX/TfpZ family type IV pilin accessory protein [Pseudomonas sp. RIT-PI-AD]
MSFRSRAFFIHLTFSVCLTFIAFLLVLQVWYVDPLYKVVGVIDIFFMMILVDLLIGPLLTFFIAKPLKKSLVFDVSVIVLVQVLFYLFGLFSIWDGRPIWLVYTVDRFDVIQAYELASSEKSVGGLEFSSYQFFGPKWAYTKIPTNASERDSILFESLSGGKDFSQHPEYYRPLNEAGAIMLKNSQPISTLKDFNNSDKVDSLLKNWPTANSFLPMMGKTGALTVLLQKRQPYVLGVVDLRPWQ